MRIFVGDVQGCADELEELLARARTHYGDAFEAWFVGDLLNRGPASRRVLERVRALHDAGRARVVLGNHEIGFMMKALGLRPMARGDTLKELLEAPDRDDWIEWLRRLPLVETGEIAGVRFAMVHAAVHPDWDRDALVRNADAVSRALRDGDLDALAGFLVTEAAARPERDTLDRLTRCRSVIDDRGTWSDEPPRRPEDAWHARWSARQHRYGVVYGHWALQGLHVAPWLRGLDTACVHHGRPAPGGEGVTQGKLTAWLADEQPLPPGGNPFGVPDTRFWQVRARRAYAADAIAFFD